MGCVCVLGLGQFLGDGCGPVIFWCNDPVRGCSLDLQVGVDTSGRTGDDDTLSSG